ncbi:EAL domain-containing protein [Enterovibrio sp. 27052020O]|uniref:EAL domain-containing protein n=1 Tax=Enterovibrio sp. 27052020O TaxID=3241166 RepID=UPI00388E2785
MDENKTARCEQCMTGKTLGFEFTMAFQPIVDVKNSTVFGYEALVRGVNGESAYSIIQQVNGDNRYLFDQSCRVKAISLAAELGLTKKLSINFLPNAVYQPERCIRTTLQEAKRVGFPIENIMFEVTEVEKVLDNNHLKVIFDYYQKQGFSVALDDFGAGYAGLNLLADLTPNIVKLDMGLIRDIDASLSRQVIVHNTVKMLHELGCDVLAEGVETQGELDCLRAFGIDLFQGYFFARPTLEALPEVGFSVL